MVTPQRVASLKVITEVLTTIRLKTVPKGKGSTSEQADKKVEAKVASR